jgi:hypothetical protein
VSFVGDTPSCANMKCIRMIPLNRFLYLNATLYLVFMCSRHFVSTYKRTHSQTDIHTSTYEWHDEMKQGI